MIAASGEKSIMPARGRIRRRGDRTGSVMRYRMTDSMFVCPGENQDKIARRTMAIVSSSHRIRIRLKNNAIAV